MLTEEQMELIEYRRYNFREMAHYCAKKKQSEKARYYIREANRSDWFILNEIYTLFPHLRADAMLRHA